MNGQSHSSLEKQKQTGTAPMGQQHESNSAGLEKQSPLEIHRLSPEIGSAKSAYSVAES